MFHVFYVNHGFMMVLDMPVLANVLELNKSIFEAIDVPVDEQFLLLENGESLDNNRSLSSYNVGTENNPVYFIRANYINTNKTLQQVKEKEEREGRLPVDDYRRHLNQIESAQDSAIAIKGYSDIAKTFYSTIDSALVYCAQIIRDHKLMNNGWTALMSNLDDSITKLERRLEKTSGYSERMRTMREKGAPMIQNFDNILATLEKISIPPQLLADGDEEEGHLVTLYDWLASKDKDYSVKVIAEHAKNQMTLSSESKELEKASMLLKSVREQSRKTEYRDIKGITKRLEQLESKLQSMEDVMKKVKSYSDIVALPGPSDLSQATVFTNQQKKYVDQIMMDIAEFDSTMGSFIKSKLEVLKNILTRLSGWVKTIYERLNSANNEMMLLENIYNGLKQRLDVVRQVRDAPIMYAIAVTEVIRRNAFRKEFDQWLSVFIEKCRQFLKDENCQRSEFFCRLDQHFIRQLFPGMGDSVPDICPDRVKFDESLPELDAEVIRNLRKTVPDLEFFLKADVPQVFSKLLVCDSALNQSISAPGIRREESFFVRDGSANIGTLTRNFPSSTWLSGEDNIEMSPALNRCAMLMAKGVKASSSSASIHEPPKPLTNSLYKMCSRTLIGSSLVLQRKALRSTFRTTVQILGTLVLMQTSQATLALPTIILAVWAMIFTKFITLVQQEMEVPASSAQSAKSQRDLSHLRVAVQYIAEEASALKSCVADTQVSFREVLLEAQKIVAERTFDFMEKMQEKNAKTLQDQETKWKTAVDSLGAEIVSKSVVIEERDASIVELQSEVRENNKLRKELDEKLEQNVALVAELNDMVSELSSRNEELLRSAAEQRQNLEHFEEKLKESEEKIAAFSEERNQWETEKEQKKIDPFFVGFEFLSNLLKRDLTEEEMTTLKTEHDRRRAESTATICDCLGAETVAGEEASIEEQTIKESVIRSDVEKEYKNRMQLLVRGMEERNSKEIAKVKEEVQSSFESEISGYKERILDLESRLGSMEFNKSMQAISNPEPSTSGLLNAFPSGGHIQESCMLLSRDGAEGIAEEIHDEIKEAMEDEDDSDGFAAVHVNTIATQTRLCLKEMRMMISLSDIHEGCAVLIMWDEVHNSYTVFCSSPTLHFVKESSMKRMGVLGAQKPATRRNLILATITHIEFCQIKKIDNRYKLPMDTRFYRVDIEALPLESTSYRRRRND
ncbi:hypothetical protein L596_003365 [Steinernema carpocapsae]|uniref:Ubiquitin-like domain-containing protein n=1 Tax=Steinernema carpocapsae TaxID=34508 RepID=A0A4U8USC4_STECR|nr:hypothetical protein L596_003365 [Steinernema carpocapsae]